MKNTIKFLLLGTAMLCQDIPQAEAMMDYFRGKKKEENPEENPEEKLKEKLKEQYAQGIAKELLFDKVFSSPTSIEDKLKAIQDGMQRILNVGGMKEKTVKEVIQQFYLMTTAKKGLLGKGTKVLKGVFGYEAKTPVIAYFLEQLMDGLKISWPNKEPFEGGEDAFKKLTPEEKGLFRGTLREIGEEWAKKGWEYNSKTNIFEELGERTTNLPEENVSEYNPNIEVPRTPAEQTAQNIFNEAFKTSMSGTKNPLKDKLKIIEGMLGEQLAFAVSKEQKGEIIKALYELVSTPKGWKQQLAGKAKEMTGLSKPHTPIIAHFLERLTEELGLKITLPGAPFQDGKAAYDKLTPEKQKLFNDALEAIKKKSETLEDLDISLEGSTNF